MDSGTEEHEGKPEGHEGKARKSSQHEKDFMNSTAEAATFFFQIARRARSWR
jgi:hypothetical protein